MSRRFPLAHFMVFFVFNIKKVSFSHATASRLLASSSQDRILSPPIPVNTPILPPTPSKWDHPTNASNGENPKKNVFLPIKLPGSRFFTPKTNFFFFFPLFVFFFLFFKQWSQVTRAAAFAARRKSEA